MCALLVAAPAAAGPSRRLIWSDEFDGSSLDPGKWSYDLDCWGGGNAERQCYTSRPANVSVSGGLLHITARTERVQGPARPREAGGHEGETAVRAFSSGRIRTRDRASFRYGRIEVRARLPGGQGVWPAIWLLPEHDNYGPYPLSGEIDLAEAVNLGVPCPACAGGHEDRVHGALHGGPPAAAQPAGSLRLTQPDGFHVFALEWTPSTMTWLVDGRPYLKTASRPPFDQRFHLVLNLAVGGRWPEGQDRGGIDRAALPATLLVDWVRVYE